MHDPVMQKGNKIRGKRLPMQHSRDFCVPVACFLSPPLPCPRLAPVYMSISFGLKRGVVITLMRLFVKCFTRAASM